jgi:predicted Zn-dependent peptidase
MEDTMQFTRLSLLTIVVSCVSSSLVTAQSDPYDLPIREHMFPNGLRLLVLERPGDYRVAAKIFTDFGAMVEEPGELGAAHFLEHLMFKGTQTLGATNWEAERLLVGRIRETERVLIAELDRARNDLRERGVIDHYRHAKTTPTIDSLRATITRLDAEAAQYRDNGAMMRWYQAFGGTGLTATTEQEYMKFDINLPKERVALFFRVEADRMRNSVFREFDQERMILVEQRLGDLNRPTTPYYEQMNAAVGVVHPVFWPEGYPTDFYEYTRAYQRDLYERYFVPNNTTIVLVGGVSLEEMVPLVDHFFSWMERQPEPTRVRAVEPKPSAERRVIYRSKVLAPRIEARYMIPAVGHPDRPLFDVLGEVVRREVRDGLRARDVGGQVNVNTRIVHASRFGAPGSINVEIVVRGEAGIAPAEAILLNTLERLGQIPVAVDRLDLAKKKLRTEWHRTAHDADRVAFEIGHFQVMDRWQTLEVYLKARDAATPAAIMGLASRYFVPENRTIGVVKRPEGQTPATREDESE